MLSESILPGGHHAASAHLLVFNLFRALVSKGLLTQPEAMSVPIRTADMLRNAWAGEPDEADAETSAQSLEMMASWLAPESGQLLNKELRQ